MSWLRGALWILVVGAVCCGCRSAAPRSNSSGSNSNANVAVAAAPAPAAEIHFASRAEAKQAVQDMLMRAVKPKITHVDQVDADQLRYRSSGFMGRGRTFTLYLYKFGKAEVTKRVWAFVYEKNGRRVDKIRFATGEQAQHYCDVLAYLAGPEFKAISDAEKVAQRQAVQPAPAPPPPTANDEPCVICGEPRGDRMPCPHCGMD